MLELRGHGTLKASGNKTLTGIAAVFNSEANLGPFSEIVRPGAFAKSLATGSNIRALYHHDGSALLGTTRGGTLQLRIMHSMDAVVRHPKAFVVADDMTI